MTPRVRALALFAAVALRGVADAGEDEAITACRDAWSERKLRMAELDDAYRRQDETQIRVAGDAYDATMRRFHAAFARVAWDTWGTDKDGELLEHGLDYVGGEARLRGDLGGAKGAFTALVAKRCSSVAFKARGLSLPELSLAAGDVDAALEGFRMGARQPKPHPDGRDLERGLTARLRIGDVFAACGDIAAARAEYATARKEIDVAAPRPQPWQAWAAELEAQIRAAIGAELDARDLIGKPLPALVAHLGGSNARQGCCFVVYAGRVGWRGDAGRLLELDRLASADPARFDVRIVATADRIGARRGDAVNVRLPRAADDAEGDEIPATGTNVASFVAKLRERLALRSPITTLDAAALPPPLDRRALVLVADASGVVVHASVAGEHTDWICGLARAVAEGRKPRPPAPPTPLTAQEQEAQRATCAKQLAALVKDYERRVKLVYLEYGRQNERASGGEFWIRTTDEEDLTLGCPSDPAFPVVSVYADRYLLDPSRCSYAGPARIPIPRDLKEGLPDAVVAACLHHPGGAVIARANGKVEFLQREELDLASDAEKTVGPESKSPLLRGLR